MKFPEFYDGLTDLAGELGEDAEELQVVARLEGAEIQVEGLDADEDANGEPCLVINLAKSE